MLFDDLIGKLLMRDVDVDDLLGLSEMRFVDVDWVGGFPGGVEGCAECGTPLEVVPGQRRVGAFRYHLSEPDLFCDDCVAKERPDLLEPDGTA